MEVFKVTGQNGQHSFLFRLWQGARDISVRQYSISIRVWGIASLSLLGSFHNLLEDTRNSLTLSFYPPLTLLRLRSNNIIIMIKKVFLLLTVMVYTMTGLSAQDYKSTIAERKAMAKYTKSELNEKASKAARKEAKNYLREGWQVAPGHLPLEKQLDKSYQMQYEFDESGYPKYIMSEAMSIGGNYDAGKMQALELAKISLAGLLQSEVVALVENSIANKQLTLDQAASVTESVMAAKNIISQKIGRVITVVECYRDTKTKNKEIRVMIAYNTAMAMEAAKSAVKEELEKKGDELHTKLDNLLNL